MRTCSSQALVFWVALVLLDLAIATAGAQQPAMPPIRPLGPIVATAADSLKTIGTIRQLSDGRLFVNDPAAKRLLLFDATLAHSRTVIDTSATASRRYTATSYMRPYLGDSTLFIDTQALAVLVIDPSGTIQRVLALPTLDTRAAAQYSSVDSHGRLIYDGYDIRIRAQPAPSGTSVSQLPQPDSEAILRADLATGRVDTVAFIRLPQDYPSNPTTDADGFTWPTIPTRDPMPTQDDWAAMSDGTVAVVRVQDFHVDWFAPDGGRTSSAKLPHEWHRLSDSVKAALVDSLRQWAAAHPTRQIGKNGAGATKTRMVPSTVPDPTALPDYDSPFIPRIRSDADNNLWIRENPKADAPTGGPVYDVISRAGVMIDRVQIPGGTSIEGFGPGCVYLSERVAGGLTLARARTR